MRTRIISGAVVTLLAIAAILAGGTILATVLMLVGLTAYRELCRAVGVRGDGGSRMLEMTGYAGILLYYFLLWVDVQGIGCLLDDNMWLSLVSLFIGVLMVMMAVYVFTFPRYKSEQVMSAFFCMMYAPVMLSFIYLTALMPYGIYTVWMIFISSWVCDTCAYFSGMAFGRHKMAPRLSPKKTVEGALGGILGSAVAGAVFALLLQERVFPGRNVVGAFAAIGAVGAAISQVGDLAASAVKRNHNIKDYGTCIPGHGGIMDRFDSVIFTAPVIYFMARLLTGI